MRTFAVASNIYETVFSLSVAENHYDELIQRHGPLQSIRLS